jgi:DNA-binding NarL/FixJ family response regulator
MWGSEIESRCRSAFDLDEQVCAALRAGASGFLLKDVAHRQEPLPSGSWEYTS